MPGKLCALSLAVVGVLASGCTQPLRPMSVEPVPLTAVGSFGGGTLGVRVSEEARGRESMRAESGVKYETSIPEWNVFFAEDFAKELERRGVAVSADHDKRVVLYLYDIWSDLDGLAYKARVHLKATDQNGKTLIDEVFRATHPRMGTALSMSLHHAKLALLQHEGLRALLQ